MLENRPNTTRKETREDLGEARAQQQQNTHTASWVRPVRACTWHFHPFAPHVRTFGCYRCVDLVYFLLSRQRPTCRRLVDVTVLCVVSGSQGSGDGRVFGHRCGVDAALGTGRGDCGGGGPPQGAAAGRRVQVPRRHSARRCRRRDDGRRAPSHRGLRRGCPGRLALPCAQRRHTG